jgi:cytochrome c556
MHRTVLPAALALGVLVGAAPEQGDKQADKPKAIKDVMALHKGKESFLSKVTGGKGTEEDHKKLLSFYEVLATLKPPQGEEKSWKEKTDALIAAAKEVVEKKEGALDKLKKASDCKACHSVHKPK